MYCSSDLRMGGGFQHASPGRRRKGRLSLAPSFYLGINKYLVLFTNAIKHLFPVFVWLKTCLLCTHIVSQRGTFSSACRCRDSVLEYTLCKDYSGLECGTYCIVPNHYASLTTLELKRSEAFKCVYVNIRRLYSADIPLLMAGVALPSLMSGIARVMATPRLTLQLYCSSHLVLQHNREKRNEKEKQREREHRGTRETEY